MSWYDYVPVVGQITRAASDFSKGNAAGGFENLADPGGLGYDISHYASAVHGANNEQKQGYYNAAAQMHQMGQDQKNFAMQGLNQAEGYYAPARARIQAAYGDPGSVTR